MLYVIGLGLSDEKDITVKGLEVCRHRELFPPSRYTSFRRLISDAFIFRNASTGVIRILVSLLDRG